MSLTLGWDLFKLVEFFPARIWASRGKAAARCGAHVLGFFVEFYVVHNPSEFQ